MTALLKSGDTSPHSKNDGYGTLCLYPPYETTTEFLA